MSAAGWAIGPDGEKYEASQVAIDAGLLVPTAEIRRWRDSVSVQIPPWLVRELPDGTKMYTGEQLRQAVLAERERCAQIAEWLPDGSGHFGNVAAAIRKS